VDQVVSIEIPKESRRLNNFKRILLICQATITFIICFYFLFEDSIITLASRYLPTDDGKTFNYYHDLFRLGIAELLWLSVSIILAIGLYSRSTLLFNLDALETKLITNHRTVAHTLIAIVTALVVVIAFFVLQQFPNSSDEYVYLYQARTLSDGKFYYDAPPVEEAFGFNHIAHKDGISVGRFPPGWPLLLSIFLFFGLPAALVNPLLALITLLVFYRLAIKLCNPHVAVWGLILLTCSGFFLLNSASFFSHTSCLLEAVLMVYFINEYMKTGKPVNAIVSGIFLGLIFLTRYYTAFLLFLPIALYLFRREGVKSFVSYLLIGIGTVPFIAFLLYYNYSVTGNALMPVTVWAYEGESLGFVHGHTFGKAIEHIVRRMIMFMYSASPILLFLYFFYLIKKVRAFESAVSNPEDYFFLLLIAGYIFYYEIGGNQYGPRFYYEAYPFVILFVLRQVFSRGAYWAKVLLYATLIVMIIKIPLILHREYNIIEERTDVYRRVEAANITNAVVILKSGTGVVRPMPTGDLSRNDPAYQNDVLYAVDNADYNDDLINYYKDRSIYQYVRKPGEVEGRLIRIR
jgi:hypothetical protein